MQLARESTMKQNINMNYEVDPPYYIHRFLKRDNILQERQKSEYFMTFPQRNRQITVEKKGKGERLVNKES